MSDPRPPFMLMRIPLIISGLLYFGLAYAVVAFLGKLSPPGEPPMPDSIITVLALFSAALGLGAILLGMIFHVRSKVIYYIMFGVTVLYVPSAYIFLGIPMLVFLIRKDSRTYYDAGF